MIKKAPPGDLYGDLSWALDCIVLGLSKSNGKTEPESELDFLKTLADQAEYWGKVPASAHKHIGEILFESLDKNPPCDRSIAPDSIKAPLPDSIREKLSSGQKMTQAEHLLIAEEVGNALILKAWLANDPSAAGKAHVDSNLVAAKARHGTYIEARANELWKKKKATSSINKNSANARHARTTSKKEQLIEIWASGKYSSRDICAEQECAALGISFSTARKALRNTPDPQHNS